MRARSDHTHPPAAAAPGRFLGALHHRHFRQVWCAWSAASLAQRIDGILVGWLVLDLTDSAFLVGLVGSMRFLGALLGPVTGVIADRWDRRRLQLYAGGAMAGMVATLLVLAVLQRLDVWALLLTTTLGGLVWAGAQPAQQSLPADLLSGRDLVNGIALLNMAMNVTAMLGPAVGGALLAASGLSALPCHDAHTSTPMSPDSTGADSLFSCEPVHYTPAMSDSPQVGSAGALRAALWL